MSEKIKLQDAYLKFLKKYRNKVTREAFDQTMKPFIAAIGPQRPVANVTKLDLIDYVGDLRSEERIPLLRQTTVNKHVKHIKVFFNWCVNVAELIPSSPANSVKTERVPKDAFRRPMMSDEDEGKVLAYAAYFPRVKALFLYLRDSAGRRGGAAGLRVRDLDLANCEAIVMEKDKKARIVFFSHECSEAIRIYLNVRGNAQPESFVFSRKGEAISAPAIAQFFRRFCIKSGAGNWGPHQLRRKKIKRLLSARVSVQTVSEIVGHSNVETTLGYLDKDMRETRAVAREFNGFYDDDGKILKLPRTGTE